MASPAIDPGFSIARGRAASPLLEGAPARSGTAGRAPRRASPRRQFNLLVVRGDGVRVVRLRFPRRLAVGVFAASVVGAAVFGVLVGDWWHVRQRMRDSASLYREIDEQRRTIDGFNRRVSELRREMAGWRELHARIWEPFGPDRAPRLPETGIGGARPSSDRDPDERRGDELARLTEQVMQEGESLRALDRLIGRARKALIALPSRWPVRGRVNSEYGNRLSPWTKAPEFHGGIDIAAHQGTVVRAPAPGVVVHAGPHTEYGLAVVLDHGQELRTIYGHLSKIRVQIGQHVERGTELALTGNTGRSSGPHLHYEILLSGRPVNPRAYFWD
jgi:murein DD-endopeptidase MepM/ murein hydrolase activator NlpD